MRLARAALAAALLAYPCAPRAAAADATSKAVPSLCEASEKPILRWGVKNSDKLVSLCASADFGKDRGWLQYRFGRPGAVELRFPATTEGTHAQFVYGHVFRARFDETSLSFVNHDIRYTLEDGYDGEGARPVKTTEISIEPADGKGRATTVHCRELAPPDLAALGDALPNHAE